ncbi:MAG: molybdopterin cofactor-binding domain-containing protein [Bacteroidota bacterium]
MTLIKTTYNRRSFLKASTAAGGGLMLGFSWLASCSPSKEKMMAMPDSWFDINAYIKIGENGMVTIYSPNPEVGQNIKTSMPMIVAEELDVDWKYVLVEQAPLNTQDFDRQIAGGSNSIRSSWDALRMAGATARRMLLEAAAKEWNVPVAELSTDKGVIKHSSGKTMGYGEVSSAASMLDVPEEVEVKDIKDFKLIGKPTGNVDIDKIITGKPLFGMDYKEEGMLIAMLIHAPGFGMKLKGFNADAAKGMPGIVDVFSVKTTNDELNDLSWYGFDEIIAIVGKTTWQVMKAKRALSPEWEWTSTPESTYDHEKKIADSFNDVIKEPERIDGDPKTAFKNAAKVVERSYTAPFLAHNTMEPMNFFANVKGDQAEVVGPIQTPERLRGYVASYLSIPEDKVSVKMTRIGGGFGRRLYGNFGLEAVAISKKVNAPVKLVYTREDDMTQGVYRPAYGIKFRAALDAENNLIAYHVKGTGIRDSAVYANRFPAGAVENYLAESTRADSNVTTGAWRAPRSNFVAGAESAFLDELAEEAGKDPIDFRLELFERSINSPVGERNDYEPERYAGVLKLVKEKSNWGTETPGVYRGVAAYFCHNSYVAQVLDLVKENGTPKVKKVWCAVDCGIVVNPEGAKNQVEGSIVDGIGHGMFSSMTFKEGTPEQQNFDKYRLIRHKEAPEEIEIFFVKSDIHPTGLGEPALPPVIGALANALYKATGKRVYSQPFAQKDIVLG